MTAGKRLQLASLWMIAATGVVNISMVVFHRIMSAGLGADYARLVSLMAIANVLGAVTLGVNTFMVKDFSRDSELAGPGAVKGRLLALWKPALLAVGLSCAALLAAAGPVMAYLKLPSFGELALVVLAFGLGLCLLILRAAVQGLHYFWALGSSLIAEGFARVAGAASLVGGLGVAGGMSAIVCGQGLGGAVALAGLSGLGAPRQPAAAAAGRGGWRARLGEAGADSLVLLLFSLMGYLDLFIAKHYYDDQGASGFSRAALVAKSFLHLTAALNMVLLPAVAAAREGGRNTKVLLMKFLGAAAAIDAAGMAFVWLFTDFCVQLLCGPAPAYLALSPLVRVFSAATILQALFQLCLFYLLAMRSRAALNIMACLLPAYYALLHFRHDQPIQIVAGLALAAGAGLAGAFWSAMRPGAAA